VCIAKDPNKERKGGLMAIIGNRSRKFFTFNGMSLFTFRRRLQLSDTQAFYLIINSRSMASASMSLAEIYCTEKDDDGFLYITYASQEMFG